eukprot:1324922-Rhodomonas_salina.3
MCDADTANGLPGGTQVADCSPKHSGHGVSSWPKDKDNAGHGLSSWPKEKEREQGREEERARGRRRSESPAGSSRDRFRGTKPPFVLGPICLGDVRYWDPAR